ncbi:MAG TPA: hypothetical protein VJC11_00345 [Patescibacteria group bacterium]|nr:hypothetical protein [Patescibacteria group bacterium]
MSIFSLIEVPLSDILGSMPRVTTLTGFILYAWYYSHPRTFQRQQGAYHIHELNDFNKEIK